MFFSFLTVLTAVEATVRALSDPRVSVTQPIFPLLFGIFREGVTFLLNPIHFSNSLIFSRPTCERCQNVQRSVPHVGHAAVFVGRAFAFSNDSPTACLTSLSLSFHNLFYSFFSLLLFRCSVSIFLGGFDGWCKEVQAFHYLISWLLPKAMFSAWVLRTHTASEVFWNDFSTIFFLIKVHLFEALLDGFLQLDRAMSWNTRRHWGDEECVCGFDCVFDFVKFEESMWFSVRKVCERMTFRYSLSPPPMIFLFSKAWRGSQERNEDFSYGVFGGRIFTNEAHCRKQTRHRNKIVIDFSLSLSLFSIDFSWKLSSLRFSNTPSKTPFEFLS